MTTQDPQKRVEQLEFNLEKLMELKHPEGATKEMILKMRAPTQPNEIEWRIQSCGEKKDGTVWAKIVPYIDARAVIDRLDSCVGPNRWQDNYTPIKKGFLCTLMIHTQSGWISKQDAADFTDIEAIKGGISDSLKRAAVKWGIGRDLYSYGECWAETTTTENWDWYSAKTKDGKKFWWTPAKIYQAKQANLGAKS